VFVNADLIAAGLSPFAPEKAAIQAGRLMLKVIAQHVAKSANFAFETTLAGKIYARHIPAWRAQGYKVTLLFLSLPSADIAVQRVAERVRQGGHDIPESTIRRRFDAGKELFANVYRPVVDQWALYDNSGDKPVLTDWSDATMNTSHHVNQPEPDHGMPPMSMDADLKGSFTAIQRAALQARRLAVQTGTDLIVVRDGQLVRVSPEDVRHS
jgi:predicted ABC-type ATPase